MSDGGIEDVVCDSQSSRGFVDVDLLRQLALDATTLLKFRRLLEKHSLTRPAFDKTNAHLTTQIVCASSCWPAPRLLRWVVAVGSDGTTRTWPFISSRPVDHFAACLLDGTHFGPVDTDHRNANFIHDMNPPLSRESSDVVDLAVF